MASILSDGQIKELAQKGMITPYVDTLVKEENGRKLISYGQSSYGYDLRLGPEVLTFPYIPRGHHHNSIGIQPLGYWTKPRIDPKNFDEQMLYQAFVFEDKTGKFVLLPPRTYALGHAVETIKMPDNVTAICLGKSTYARSGIILNMTPFEAGWVGCPTLEIFNATDCDSKLYIGEGIVQAIFYEAEMTCETSYRARNGKYQNQATAVVTARV